MSVYVWLNKKQGEHGVYYLVDRDPRHPNGRKMTKLGPTEQDRIDGEAAAAARTEEIKAEKALALRQNAPLVGGQPILGETAFLRWWEIAKGGYSENLRRQRRWLIFDHMIPYFGEVDLRRLTPEHIATFCGQLALTNKRRGKGKLGWHTVKNSLIALRRLLRWLEGQEHLQFRNPVREKFIEVGMTAAESNGARLKKRVAWSQDEAEKILDVASRRPDLYALLYGALHTGMRKGELLALEWADVNLEAGVLEVSKSKLRTGDIKATKTGKERRVDISDGLHGLLVALAEQRFGRLPNPDDEGCVFQNRRGQSWNYDIVNNVWKRVRDDAHKLHKVKRLPFHCFRHTFASWGLKEHADTAWLAMQLGHDVNILLEVYAHFIPEERTPHFLNRLGAAAAALRSERSAAAAQAA